MSIWKFSTIKSSLTADQYFSLNEGNTKIDNLIINEHQVYLKREDLNPTGSYKDRGSAYKVTQLISQGIKEVVISSSGNAAISLLTYGKQFGLKVNAVVSPNANPTKLDKLKELAAGSQHQIHIDPQARNAAARISAERGIPNLRASTDPTLPIGYRSLALELEPDFTDVFVATSSGTALVGIAQGLLEKGMHTAVHACQTSIVHPIADEFQQAWQQDADKSLADAIVDKIALRKQQVVRAIKESGGYAWILSNREIEAAYKQANEQLSQPISYTSALSIAGFVKATEQGKLGGKILCIASGT